MIGMQYRFCLPKDYDMSIIRRRIEEKGHLFDGITGLKVKTFLTASGSDPNAENLYAPFYVWDEVEAMNSFFMGEAFKSVSSAFGWPPVELWSGLAWQKKGDTAGLCWARKTVTQIPRYTDLKDIRSEQERRCDEAYNENEDLIYFSGYDPGNWTLVEFQALQKEPSDRDAGVERYVVDYTAVGA